MRAHALMLSLAPATGEDVEGHHDADLQSDLLRSPLHAQSHARFAFALIMCAQHSIVQYVRNEAMQDASRAVLALFSFEQNFSEINL